MSDNIQTNTGAVAKVDESSAGATAPFLCLKTGKQAPKNLLSMV